MAQSTAPDDPGTTGLATAPIDEPAPGITAEVHARRWWMLSVLCLSLLIIMIGNTSLNVALPSLSEELSATNSQLQWMVDAYSLVFAGLLFAAGNFGDRYGRKGILQIGLVVFGLATAYAAFFAETSAGVIGARVGMGVGAAMVMPATLSIITNIFPVRERARAVAIWAGISGAGAAVGPLLSGFVLEHGTWNEVFLINVPFVLVALGVGAFLVPRSRGEHHTPLDLLGAVLSAVGLGTLVFAIIEGPVYGWTSPVTIGVGTVGLLVLVAFVLWELHVEHPMLDVRLFRIGAFGTSALVLTMVFFALDGHLLLVDPDAAAGVGLLAPRSGGAHGAHLGRDHDRCAPVGEARRPLRQATGRRDRHVDDRGGCRGHLHDGRRAELPAPAGRHVRHGARHGHRHVADDRPVDVVGPPHPGRHGLGDERHDPRARRVARRGGLRQPAGLALRRRARR